jgi:mono/diheme cytochrome c family protein
MMPAAIHQNCALLLLLQVENGKGAMPAWSGTLDDDEIAAGERLPAVPFRTVPDAAETAKLCDEACSSSCLWPICQLH